MKNEKIYKLIVYFKKTETITIAFYNEDYACVKGELLKATSTNFKHLKERIFIGRNKEKMIEVLNRLKKRGEYHSYDLEEIQIKDCEEL
ncbi:MAG: hypothetical protein Q4A58_04000 [Fusobacterium sp.]|uniref:hypothetical protein n=1 Tax=Fusobacterium sp. TaxID=68766 RepID=UPI0026DB21BB|nr:hypothetical protein [Fusobacterium sp.]MDO4690441.1 hypothetical protein [Fusobacterium sp.]